MHPRIEERRRDVGYAACLEIVRPRGPLRTLTASERREEENLRAYVRRAASAGQITDREQLWRHGYISALFLQWESPSMALRALSPKP